MNHSQDPKDAQKAKEEIHHHEEHRPEKTAKEDKVPILEKSLYGLGSPSMGMVNQVIEYQVQQVMVYGLGMSPVLKGIMIMIFRIWDGFTDPVMGWLSDNTRTKWGRRRPYMFAGAILMTLIMPFVWRFNEEWDMLYIAIWFTFFGMIMSTATTIFNIPYQTLKMEMTPDYNERTSINVYSGVIIKLFSFISPWVWKMSQQPFFTGQAPGEEPNTLLGIRALAIWFAGMALILGMVPTLICKERYYKQALKQKKESLIASLKLTFKSKPFLMMLVFIFANSLEGLVTGMGGYISLYYVFGGDKVFAATFGGISGTLGTALGLLTIPLFGWLASRFGKERALLVNTVASMLMSLSILICYNPNYPWLVMIPAVLNGTLIAGYWTVVPAMKADIVDEDEIRTGERREGSFESIFSWFLRFSGTIFAGISGFVVVGAGFDIALETEQADGVFRRMILWMALIPFVLGLLQCWIIFKWPLTPGRMGEIRDELEARRGKINEAEPEEN